MAFGQNIEEILLQIRAEGRGEVDAVKQAMAELRDTADGLLGTLGDANEAKDFLKIFRDVGTINRQLGEMEKYLASIGASEVAAARAVAKERAEIAKQERIEREINLRQAAADAKKATKEQVDAEKAARGERATILKEQRAAEKAAAREQAAAEKEIAREREHNLRETARIAKEEARAEQATKKQLFADTKSNMDAEVALFRQAKAEEEAAEKRSADAKAAVQKANLERLKRALAEKTQAEREAQVELEKNLNRENDRLERQSRAMEQGAGAAHRFGYGLLNIAHAVQDAQYGFGAVLNNIPLVAQALGAGPGLAGTVMIAGVGISVFGDKLKQLGRDIGLLRDPLNDATSTIAQLKEKIAGLAEKPWKIDVDFRNLERAKQELDEIEEKQRALEAAEKDRTTMQERIGKSVKAAVTEMGGEADLGGGTRNLERIVDKLAEDQGLLAQRMSEDPRQRQLAMLLGRAGAKPMPGASGPEAMLAMANAAQAAKDAESLRAEIREDARVGIRRDTIGGGVLGSDENLKRLIDMLSTRQGQQLMRGDDGLGIRPVDPRLMQTLREATRAGQEFADDTEEWIHQVDTAFEESIARAKALGKKERAEAKQEAGQEVAALVADKKKALEGSLGADVLDLIEMGADRARIANVMTGRTRQALGVPGPEGDKAADKILRQVTEKAFSSVMAMKAAHPGMTDEDAAAAVRAAAEREAAAKADKKQFGERDPVTGKPMDEFRADQRRRRKELDAETPAGQMREFRANQQAQVVDLANQIGMARPDLNGDQVVKVAAEANKLMGMGFDQMSALNQALVNVQMQMMQVLGRQQVTNQIFMGQVNGMRQRLPSLLRAPMPLMPR